jgi:hypothetical protein
VTIATMPIEIQRDRWGRPLVVPPTGGKAVAYTRCTTYVGAIEDTYNLARWQQRMVAVGLSERPDLQLAVAAHREDKQHLNKLCEEAMEAAKSHAAATTGTALHAFTEQIDRGQEPTVPEPYIADLAAYVRATEGLQATHIEQFCVNDSLKIGGTPDRVVKHGGKLYIADVKTGTLDWGYLKIAAQLAVYSRSACYDIATGERTPHGAEVDKAIIIHLPAGTGVCRLYWVDLTVGWQATIICRNVREKRALKYADLVTPFDGPTSTEVPARVPDFRPPPTQHQLDLPGVDRVPLTLAEQITACADADTVRGLWKANASSWSDDLTSLAKQHIAALSK